MNLPGKGVYMSSCKTASRSKNLLILGAGQYVDNEESIL